MAIELFKFQEEGRDWLTRLRGTGSPQRTGLHDEPGVGKTAQCISALDALNLRRGIVIGPSVIRINWPKEFKKFSIYQRRLVVARHFNDFLMWLNGHAEVVILSFEQATNWGKFIHQRAETFDFIALDETHFLKNPDAKRTKVILGYEDSAGHDHLGIEAWAEWGFALTGTPIPNDPSDCYTQLRFVKALPKGMRRAQFLREYFTKEVRTYSNRYTCRDNKIGELQAMISNNFIRRTLAQTGVQLPPLTMSTYLVEGDNQPILELLRRSPGLDQRIIQAAEDGNIGRVGEDDHIATMRRLIGEAKAIPYAQLLLDELTSVTPTDKVVVFGIHRLALGRAREYLWEEGKIVCVTIDGTNSTNQREALEHAFMTNPDIRVAFVNIKAGGTALTLTAAARIDMLETDYVPDNNFQAIKRVHRFTQERGVLCRVITLAGSFDEVVQEIVARKIENKAPLERRDAA